MKKNRKKILIIMLVSLFIISAILTTGILTYAAYTNASRAKRVVATHEKDGMLFSSNYLLDQVGYTLANRRIVYTNSASVPAISNITICNYAQGNPSSIRPQDIEYNLNARLVMLTGNSHTPVRNAIASDINTQKISITFGGVTKTLSSSILSATFNHTLSKDTSSIDAYSLAFSADCNTDTSGLCVFIEAVPVFGESDVHDISTIDAIFNAAVTVEQTTSSWGGYFNDRGASAGTTDPADFDGFNYVVSGFGAGQITLSWDNTQLDISQVFLLENSLTPVVNGNTTSVTFNVDSDTQERYDLQFYYFDNSTITTWVLVKKYVTCTYQATQS